MPVAVVIEKRATGVPALQARRGARRHAGLFRDVGECSIAVVAIQRAIAPVAHEQIFVAVVVVVAGADALPPSGARHAGFQRDIGERAVPIVLVQTADRLWPFGKVVSKRVPLTKKMSSQPSLS